MKGFSLIEIMIVIAIIGILGAIAYPNYTAWVIQSRRSEGISMLLQIQQQQERYFTEQLTYASDLTLLGFTVDANGKVTTEGGHYLISAGLCTSLTISRCVLMTAEPQGVQSGDGNISLDSRGIRAPASHWQ